MIDRLPTLSENRWLRLLTLCMMYVAQGVPFGFVTIALKNFLHDNGATAQETGSLVALIAIPWTFKFVWGPILDRFGIPAMGRRRPWILLAQGMMTALIFGLVLIPNLQENLRFLGAAILVINVFASMQDVAVDGLAVDLLKEHERGRANGFMYGSSYLGASLGGGVVGGLLFSHGIHMALMVQGCLMLLLMCLPLFLRERRGEKWLPWTRGEIQPEVTALQPKSLGELFKNLGIAFGNLSALVGLLLAWFSILSLDLLSIVTARFMVQDVGWLAKDYNALESGWVMAAALLGSIGGGLAADKFGIRRMIVISVLVIASTWIVFSFSESLWPSKTFIYSISIVQAIFQGLMSVSFFSLFMSIADKRVSATQFTTYMAFMNLSKLTGAKLAGVMDANFSVPTTHLFCAAFQVSILVLLIWVKPGKGDPIASLPPSP